MTSVFWSPEEVGIPDPPDGVFVLSDDAATRSFGAFLGSHLHAGDFLGLVGDLGAGKTTLVQGLVASASGGHASSPTYTLVNEYEGDVPIVHMDLYRLETADDLESIGYWDYIGARDALLCVEWLNLIPDAWPGEGVILVLLTREQGGRIAKIWNHSSNENLVSLLQNEHPLARDPGEHEQTS